MPDQAIQLGDIVICRLTNRVGEVIRILEPDHLGRRYYVRWRGLSPDLSLMSAGELIRPDGGAEA